MIHLLKFKESLLNGIDYNKEDDEQRESAFHIYNLTSSKNLPDEPIDCTYIKIGHIDILFGAGSIGEKNHGIDKEVINKIKYLCNDNVLDYLIVPSCRPQSYNYLIGQGGLLNDRSLTFKNIIYRDSGDTSYKNQFIKFIEDKFDKNSRFPISKVLNNNQGIIPLELASNDNFADLNNRFIP